MSIYSKARTKITISTILISLAVIVGSWLLLFGTDYILFKNNLPILFSKTEIQEQVGERTITDTGLGYYVITDENNVSQMYLFGHKIK